MSGTVVDRPWRERSIDDTVDWGKYKGLTYRELAARDHGYARWAATTIGGHKGQLCAEALAVALGVTDTAEGSQSESGA